MQPALPVGSADELRARDGVQSQVHPIRRCRSGSSDGFDTVFEVGGMMILSIPLTLVNWVVRLSGSDNHHDDTCIDHVQPGQYHHQQLDSMAVSRSHRFDRSDLCCHRHGVTVLKRNFTVWHAVFLTSITIVPVEWAEDDHRVIRSVPGPAQL